MGFERYVVFLGAADIRGIGVAVGVSVGVSVAVGKIACVFSTSWLGAEE